MGPTSALEHKRWRRRRRRSRQRRRRRRRRRRCDKDLPVLQQTGVFDVKAERVETKSNEARAMELEAWVFEAERDRAGQRWR